MKTLFATFALALLALPAAAQTQKMPTLQELREAGQRPYDRYTAEKVECIPLSIFSRPAFNVKSSQDQIRRLPRGTAKDLGYGGTEAWNEFGSLACKVKLSDTAILLYEIRNGLKLPSYLADCGDEKKEYFNLLQLVKEPEAPAPQSQFIPIPTGSNPPAINVTTPPVNVSTPGVNVTTPPVTVNLMSQPGQAIPSDMRIHIVQENIQVQRCGGFQCAVNMTNAGAKVILGVAAERASARLSGAWERTTQMKVGGAKDLALINGATARDVALTNGQFAEKAAAALRPATTSINNNASAPTKVENHSSSNPDIKVEGPDTDIKVEGPKTDIKVDPKIDVKADGGSILPGAVVAQGGSGSGTGGSVIGSGNGGDIKVDASSKTDQTNTQTAPTTPGPKGDPGKDGTDGKDGDKGDKGDKGNPGTNGTNGTDGKDGKDGIDGKDGEKGDKGDKGDPGKDHTPTDDCDTDDHGNKKHGYHNGKK